ncbi:MAG TPA: hotdog fold thioesterase [Trueperaceae bacterium]|nr:hotdog fold thioesterase [Trueperaceae bacterium]
MPTETDKRARGGGGRRYLGTVPGTLLETLGIVVTRADPDRVEATMPVTPRHHQPHGILHGGASVALAETVASVGASQGLAAGERAVGLEINANHIRQVADGEVHAVGTPLHRGRRTHVWQVEVRDPQGRLVCVSRCTVAIITG